MLLAMSSYHLHSTSTQSETIKLTSIRCHTKLYNTTWNSEYGQYATSHYENPTDKCNMELSYQNLCK